MIIKKFEILLLNLYVMTFYVLFIITKYLTAALPAENDISQTELC